MIISKHTLSILSTFSVFINIYKYTYIYKGVGDKRFFHKQSFGYSMDKLLYMAVCTTVCLLNRTGMSLNFCYISKHLTHVLFYRLPCIVIAFLLMTFRVL